MNNVITDILMDVATLVEVRRLTTRFVDLTQSRNQSVVNGWLADYTHSEIKELANDMKVPYVIESEHFQVEVYATEIKVFEVNYSSYVKAGDDNANSDIVAPMPDKSLAGSDYDVDAPGGEFTHHIAVNKTDKNGERKIHNIIRDLRDKSQHELQVEYTEQMECNDWQYLEIYPDNYIKIKHVKDKYMVCWQDQLKLYVEW